MINVHEVSLPSSEILRLVTLLRTDVSEELSAPIIRVAIIGELGTLAVPCNRLWQARTSVRTDSTRLNIPEDCIRPSHCHESLKYFMNCELQKHEGTDSVVQVRNGSQESQ
jgi:hypothetical protein